MLFFTCSLPDSRIKRRRLRLDQLPKIPIKLTREYARQLPKTRADHGVLQQTYVFMHRALLLCLGLLHLGRIAHLISEPGLCNCPVISDCLAAAGSWSGRGKCLGSGGGECAGRLGQAAVSKEALLAERRYSYRAER